MLHRYLPLLLLVVCWPAGAEIFRCEAPNGELTYAQTPCPERDSKVTVERTVTTRSDEAVDCQFAHRFALTTAKQMKRGVASSTVFDQYGGLSALSRGSVSLISYVYQYRTNDDVSAERVAALSVAKCKAKSFGDVGCEQLPVAYTNQWGGCGMTDEMTDAMMGRSGGVETLPWATIPTTPQTSRTAPTSQTNVQVSREARAQRQAQLREAKAREKEQRAACKERIREQIDGINEQMRSGYSASQGIRLRDRRRDLEEEMREC